MLAEKPRLTGVAVVLLSALAWSVNGLYTRFLTVDAWTTLVGRGVAAVAMIGVALSVLHGRDAGRLIVFTIRRGAIVIAAGAASMIAFVTALFNTTVANVTVIYFVSPLMAAVLGRFLIGDRLAARTLLAFVVALVGVSVMVGASFGTERLGGDLLALAMSASFAIVIVEMRRKPALDNLTATLLMSAVTVAVLAPFASLREITPTDAVVLGLFSFTSNILGFFAFVTAVRRIPPAEAGLIATLEIVLAPFWVWLFFSENPGRATIVGGAIVLAAVVFQLRGELRKSG